MLLPNEIVTDNFCGGGGASTAMAKALGVEVDIAVNHSPSAIAAHMANHPGTKHYLENVWRVDPLEACKGRPVGAAWFSPDCTHHSRAKSGKPKDNKRRGLARLVTHWIKVLKPTNQHPRVIFLENVAEFADWGPLGADDKPIKDRKGETFRAWRKKIESYGYVVEFRLLTACDYGAPTSRKRLFLVARRDGLPIAWPEPTHGPGRVLPYRTAAECIDWSLPNPSIFGRKKELAPATKRRIARGIRKFIVEATTPYVAPNGQTPFVSAYYGQGTGRRADEPLATITAGAAHQALICPTLIQTSYGERPAVNGKPAQAPRILDLHKPLGTVMAGGCKFGLVTAFLTQHNGGPHGGATGADLREPLRTVTCRNQGSLTTASLEPTAGFLTKFYGTSTGADLREPMPTVTAGGQHLGAVTAQLGEPAKRPGVERVLAFLKEYGGGDCALVVIAGVVYEIVDIGMRMLAPQELLIAQGFPPDYNIAPMLTKSVVRQAKRVREAGLPGFREIFVRAKPLTQEEQIELIGNSVSPPPATALVRANFPQLDLRMAS